MHSKAAREVIFNVLVTNYKCKLGTMFQLLEKGSQQRCLSLGVKKKKDKGVICSLHDVCMHQAILPCPINPYN